MIPIYTVLKDGEVLTPEVMKGVISQSVECCLAPITAKGRKGYSESNRCKNVVRAMEQNQNDFFLLMDSDVVLAHEEMIKDLMNDQPTFNREIRTVCTKGEHVQTCSYIPHGLMFLKGYKMREFKEYLKATKPEGEAKEFCLICRWFRMNKNEDHMVTLQNDKIREERRAT